MLQLFFFVLGLSFLQSPCRDDCSKLDDAMVERHNVFEDWQLGGKAESFKANRSTQIEPSAMPSAAASLREGKISEIGVQGSRSVKGSSRLSQTGPTGLPKRTKRARTYQFCSPPSFLFAPPTSRITMQNQWRDPSNTSKLEPASALTPPIGRDITVNTSTCQ